jgi:serine/threonine protein kinase
MAHPIKRPVWLEALQPGEYAALLTTGRLPSIMAVLVERLSQEGKMQAAEQYLGNYRLVRLLGAGRSGEVYLGEHVMLTMRAAIKVLHPRFTTQEITRFFREAKAISRLEHPQIVRIYDCDVTAEGRPFLMLEYAPGGTLRDRHPAGIPLPLTIIQAHLQQIAQALHYAHARSLMHRDVKPENILIGTHGQLLLADFGFALLSHHSSRLPLQELAGTVAYMAPEQLQGHPRRASDQYALGVMVYEWLTGSLPFTGSVAEIVSKQLSAAPRPPRELVISISKPVEAVVLRALAKDPKARFATVQDFAAAFLEACSPGTGTLQQRHWPR